MTTVTQGQPATPAVRRLTAWTAIEMWASLAIVAMWVAVLFDAVFGPDMVFQSGTAGTGSSTTIPSAVAVALFAAIATASVARHAYRRDDPPA